MLSFLQTSKDLLTGSNVGFHKDFTAFVKSMQCCLHFPCMCINFHSLFLHHCLLDRISKSLKFLFFIYSVQICQLNCLLIFGCVSGGPLTGKGGLHLAQNHDEQGGHPHGGKRVKECEPGWAIGRGKYQR